MDNEQLNICKKMIYDIVKEVDNTLSIHDFRMVAGPSHTNLIFDLVMPHDCKLTDKEIKNKINDKLQGRETRYYTVITFERDFC